ncbi:hypothetical protein PUN28_001717 [Cardiocondyla obscurior]|uniref:Uncharacterized protein n=1 Tax=Cardiocondyla obscurior TaxID=286306 RepID=A0AAW2GQY4_9HYME
MNDIVTPKFDSVRSRWDCNRRFYSPAHALRYYCNDSVHSIRVKHEEYLRILRILLAENLTSDKIWFKSIFYYASYVLQIGEDCSANGARRFTIFRYKSF